jgi:endonuclease-3
MKTDAEKAVLELMKHWSGDEFAVFNKHDPWRILVSGIISHRTNDNVTYPATQRLFDKWVNIESMSEADPEEVAKTIYPAGFYQTKAKRIIEIANDIIYRFSGIVPDTMDNLLTIKGVGRKTANLILTFGYHIPAICVDTHVHRISNRTGWVDTKTPEETEMALQKIIPKDLWIVTNEVLVKFGQNICKPISPKCSICHIPLLCKVGKELM